MKNLITLLALLITVHLNGQTDYSSTQKMVMDLARFWSNPTNVEKLTTRGVLTHKLDSIITRDAANSVTAKAEMEYNAEGLTTKMRQYGIDSLTSTLTLEGIITFNYQAGNLSNLLFEELNTETQEFEAFVEMDFAYDGSDRLDSVVISLEDPLFGGGFGPFIGIKQVYSGDLLVQARQWIFFALLGGWIPASITEYQYDGNDRLTELVVSSVDIGTGEIVPSTRTTYTYTAQGLQETVTNYVWADPDWTEDLRTMYTYHSNGTLFNEVEQMFLIDDWVNITWTTYPVENVTDEFPFTSYIWDSALSTWSESDSTINLLNPALPWDQVAVPSQIGVLALLGGESEVNLFDTDGSSIDETRYFTADAQTGEFDFNSRENYYYSLLEGSAVNHVLPDYLTVSPNPAQDQFVIDLDTDLTAIYNVYTSTGAIVETGNMNEGRTTVQTAGWSSGLYYVLIRMQDGGAFVHKQIVE
jgi:hypothetical protein